MAKIQTAEGLVEAPRPVQCVVKEEHIQVVAYPGELFIDCLPPQNGQAPTIANLLIESLIAHESLDTLRALLCDGCNTVICLVP